MWGNLGGVFMAKLQEEYTDVKKVRHHVEHLTLQTEDKGQRERIVEELMHVLTKAGRIPA